MNSVTAIFELSKVCDNPKYEGFAFCDERSLLFHERYSHNEMRRRAICDDLSCDFFPKSPYTWEWSLESLREKWHPPRVEGRVTPFNDFPCIGMMIPAFSERAADCLRDYLEPNGELLEFLFDSRKYHAYHCRKIVEILEHPGTVGAFYTGYSPRRKTPATSLSFLKVIPELVADLSIFRLRELPNRVFVSNLFVERVHEYMLNGFRFARVWPMPSRSDYLSESLREEREMRAKEPDGTNKLQSMIIEFVYQGTKRTDDERRRIAQYEDDIDAQLVVRSLREEYFGSLEGKRTAKGKSKLYLSCPNAQRLFTKLRPWLKSIEWPVPPRVFVREAPYDHAPEPQIEVFP
ncbi:MAG: hypothetical protein NT069_21720 [Planctomycetota bacterium]|nr:hypothetical protein [Planctomycetota bacterium]